MITLPNIFKNKEKLYKGDLGYYFKIIFTYAHNLNNPYHNLRHMLHVTWLCYDGCKYYHRQLTSKQMRNLLIAALFHDFDHSGKVIGHDNKEIERAIKGLRRYIQQRDENSLKEIIDLIKSTEFPHTLLAEDISLGARILRDADLIQGMSTAWLQQVIIGLGTESSINPVQMLKKQIPFYQKLNLTTAWAKRKIGSKKIKDKLQEIQDYLNLLS